jgi:hypothetical protein
LVFYIKGRTCEQFLLVHSSWKWFKILLLEENCPCEVALWWLLSELSCSVVLYILFLWSFPVFLCPSSVDGVTFSQPVIAFTTFSQPIIVFVRRPCCLCVCYWEGILVVALLEASLFLAGWHGVKMFLMSCAW